MQKTSAEPAPAQDWHSMPVAEVADQLQTDTTNGLSQEEAKRRLEQYGPNELDKSGGPNPLKILLRQFANILVIVLMVAAAVSFMIGEHIDATVIMAIVIINAVLGFFQEYRAEQAVEALRKMASPTATVVRHGRQAEVDAQDVVPGDILVLETGGKIAADCRVCESFNLETDEALLTGESLPVGKQTEANASDSPLAEHSAEVFMGTHVTYGRGRAIVTETGMSTQMGRIAAQVRTTDATHTGLEAKLERLATWLLIVVVGLCAIVFLIGWLVRDREPLGLFMAVVSLAVAAIPEGLPAVVTLSLAISVRHMAKRNAIVKRLSAAEALGSTTVICSDKTGTMTANEMAVVRIRTAEHEYTVEANGYEPSGDILRNGEPVTGVPALEQLARAATLCNDATLLEEGDWTITGDPTEGALLPLACKIGLDHEDVRADYPRVQEVAFDSTRKRMSTIHEANGGYLVATKGAAESILSLCTHLVRGGEVVEMDEETRAQTLDAVADMADDALRVLALAHRRMDEMCDPCNAETVEHDLTFIGLVGIIDPPRPEVAQSIAECHDAGIDVKMVTGDHRATAAAIAREIGLLNGGRVVDGRELDEMSDEDLSAAISDISVLARMAPDHKVRILEALQDRGEIVGMTGDGINDAPAIKHSDIGVGMAKKGTDVTREVSDIVLADDNFASIVAAVEEGRVVYDNIRKFTRFLLSANFGELLIISIAVLAGWPLPLLPLQILWVNLVTDGFPALALGMTKGEPDIMARPPRNPKENMLGDMVPYLAVVAVLCTAGALGGFLWEMRAHGYSYGEVVAFGDYPHGGEVTTYTVKAGQSPEQVASQYDITVEELIQLNPTGTRASISAGETIIVRAAMSEDAKNALRMAHTVVLTQIVLFELFVVFNCQSDRKSFRQIGCQNKYLFGAVTISLALHAALLYIPALRETFDLGVLSASDWGRVLLLSVPGLFISPRVLVRHHGDGNAHHKKAA